MYSDRQRRSALEYATPAADQFDAGQVEQASRLGVGQRLHTLLRRIVEVTHFTGHGIGFARVQIRGGMVLEIPLDEFGQVRAGIRMGGHQDFMRQPRDSDIPALMPVPGYPRLIAAE